MAVETFVEAAWVKASSEVNTLHVYEESNRLRMRQTPLGEQIYALLTALKDMTTDRKKYEFEMKALRDKQPSLQAPLREQKKKATEAVSNPAKVSN